MIKKKMKFLYNFLNHKMNRDKDFKKNLIIF